MCNNKHLEGPKYIEELMRPTPSGIAKLIAAWSGLSTETQILILSKLDEIHAPPYLAEKVRINALDSENTYVRYLAAKEFYFSTDCTAEEKIIKEKIENDPSSLVKYCLLEDSSRISAIFDETFKDADKFIALPHGARLAKIRELNGNGERIATLLAQVADKHFIEGKVSEIELYEIIADYLAKPKFQEWYTDNRVTYDGFGEYQKSKDIESLWRLVLKLPESISHILIENLPEASGLASEIPEDVINSMTDHQLETLLSRRDIGLEKLRKKLFWERDESRDSANSAAIVFNFNLEYDEFLKILAKPPKERVSILKDLGMTASQLSLCIFDAIHDVLYYSDVSPLGDDFENAIFARDALERRLNELEGWQRKKELTELRLYRLANSAVPWNSKEKGHPPSGELEFLSEKIVPGDTWKTFIGFSEAWSGEPSWAIDLERKLPRIYEIDEDDWEQEESDHAPSLLSSNAQNQSEGGQAELMKLQASFNRQRFLLYAVLGLVVWLLIVH